MRHYPSNDIYGQEASERLEASAASAAVFEDADLLGAMLAAVAAAAAENESNEVEQMARRKTANSGTQAKPAKAKAASNEKAAAEVKAVPDEETAVKAKATSDAKPSAKSKSAAKKAVSDEKPAKAKAEPDEKAAADAEAASKERTAAEAKAAVEEKVDEMKAASDKKVPTAKKASSEKKSSTDKPADEKPAENKTAAKKETPKPEFSDVPPILIVAAEAAPLAKTGGLADVVGALPKYLAKIGVDARIIMPFHRQIKDRYAAEATHLFDYYLGGSWEDKYVGIDKLELDGTVYYFVDNEYYFGNKIYSGDNFEGQQYAYFSEVVCDVIPNLDFDPQIIHCNDWHTALIPFKLKARYALGPFDPPRTLLTIHNLAYQGTYGDDLEAIAIGPVEKAYAWDLGCWNMMKAGIDTADMVSTVSPTYAWEITTPEFGEGLQADLSHLYYEGRLVGILNGIDTDIWNPATDPVIKERYSLGKKGSAATGKAACKKALLEELGLAPDMDKPLIAMVGRLTPQKGIGLAAYVIDRLASEGAASFALLGSGESDLEWLLRDLENRHKGTVCSYIGYDNDLSHRIYAASDFFFMPSAFEPCGISQMISMRYGSLPIVHETGGLKDTVEPFNQFTEDGDGFTFSRFDGEDALEACRRALSVYGDGGIMAHLIQNAMERDFSFDRCARSYAELYRSML